MADDHVISYQFNGLGKSVMLQMCCLRNSIMCVSAGERVIFADGVQ